MKARGEQFQVQVEEGPPHGSLYELEQTIYYRVVDVRSPRGRGWPTIWRCATLQCLVPGITRPHIVTCPE